MYVFPTVNLPGLICGPPVPVPVPNDVTVHLISFPYLADVLSALDVVPVVVALLKFVVNGLFP